MAQKHRFNVGRAHMTTSEKKKIIIIMNDELESRGLGMALHIASGMGRKDREDRGGKTNRREKSPKSFG